MKQVKFINSLMTRLLLFLIMLAVVISIFFLAAQARTAKDASQDRYSAHAEAAIKLAASFVTAEHVERYFTTLEIDDDYHELLARLRTLQTLSGMTYIFVTRIVDGGEIFIFDTDTDPETHVELGEFSTWERSGLDSNLQCVLLAGKKPEYYISKNEWGFFLSAREPIHWSDGTTAGYVGANFNMGTVLANQAEAFRISMTVTIGVFVASILLYLLIIRGLVTIPMKTLTANVSKLATGELLTPALASKKNEFSLLEDAFIDMSQRNITSKKTTDVLNKMAISFLSRCNGTLNEMLTQGLELVGTMLNLDSISIWRNPPEPNEAHAFALQIYCWNRKSGGKIELTSGLKDFTYPELAPLWQQVLTGGKNINGPTKHIPEAVLLDQFGVASVFVEPLFVDDIFWGFAMFEDHQNERWFDDDTQSIMRSAALLCMNVLQQAEMKNTISDTKKHVKQLAIEAEKAYYDPLTGIYNRRYFDEHLEQVVKTLSRSGGLISLLMIDIDFFKNYNDNYGHDSGDNCLKIIVDALNNAILRADDFLARYGGEEFVVVLPNTDGYGAEIMAKRMLKSVRARSITHEYSKAANHVTISIGVTTQKIGETFDVTELIKSADKMLYKAKQNGRNRHSSASLSSKDKNNEILARNK